MKKIISAFALIGILLCLTEDAPLKKTIVAGSYDEAFNAYQLFLNREMYGSDGQFMLKILPRQDTEYSIVDMNGDYIPELAIKSCTLQYYTADNLKMWGTISLCAIFTFEDGDVKLWYVGDNYNDFEILSNHALLYMKEGSDSYQCDYIELDHEGDLRYSISLYKEVYVNSGQDDDLIFSLYEHSCQGTNSYRIVDQEEWSKKLEELLRLRTDQIVWETIKTAEREDTGRVLLP